MIKKAERERDSSRAIELPVGVKLPPEYEVSTAGIFKNTLVKEMVIAQQVTTSPVLASASCHCVDDKTSGVELTFADGGGNQQKIRVTQLQVSSAYEIIKLSNLGVKVNSKNATDLIEFLDLQIATSKELPKIFTTKKSGWIRYNGQNYFSAGHIVVKSLMAPDLFRSVSEGEPEELQFIGQSKGKKEEWLKAILIAKKYPLVLMQVAAALAAPLLRLLKVDAAIVHIFGDSTLGKTTCIIGALSFFGNSNPDCYFGSWESTNVGLENRAYALNDMPLPIDDSSQTPYPELIEKCCYMLANGCGRARGDRSGRLLPVRRFRNLTISNGETFLLNENSKTGQTVRVIQIKEAPWGSSPEAGRDISNVNRIIKENYGFVGMDYLQRLVDVSNSDEELSSLKARHNILSEKLKQGVSNKLVLRTIPVISALGIALGIVNQIAPELGITSSDIDAMLNKILHLQEINLAAETTLFNRALDYVQQQILANSSRFTFNENLELWGAVVTRKLKDSTDIVSGYGFLPEKLREVLKKGGYDAASVMHFFREKKCVWLDSNDQLHTINFNGHSMRA